MSILEVEDIGESTPQGVALFLVSDSENGKEQESMRVLRMYNLASLISLAKWAISRKVRLPLFFIGPPTLRDHVGRPAIRSPQSQRLATSDDIEKAQGFY